MINCAKKGRIEGGPKDTIPPVFVKAEPANYTTNFDGERIRIYFDEYIKLKDFQKQLIISPPLKNTIISPQGTASKYINIAILDTLEANTTYVFNFGQSIQDNNEGNPYSYFKYIMSTGSFIDSLTVKGEIKSALSQFPDNFVTVMLYEIDSTYTDSIIYKENPRYVTNTLDSLTTFELSNLREGTYAIAALKDEDANFTFQPKKDKIAFIKEHITVPTDSSYVLTLFNEEIPVSTSRPRHTGAGKITFGVQGAIDSVRLEMISKVDETVVSTLSRKRNKDTLDYFFKPVIKPDSLLFVATGPSLRDTLTVKMRTLPADTLVINKLTKATLDLKQPFELGSSIPITEVDTTLISVVRQDSISVPFTIDTDAFTKTTRVRFETAENEAYTIQMLPEALTDFAGNKSDTLSYKVRTKEYIDYGDLNFTIANANEFPYIVQLVTEKEEVVQERFTNGQTDFTFNILAPGKYLVRLIKDANGNQRYDSGDYLKRQQPEAVIYYPKVIDIRAGWLPTEVFTLTSK